MARSPVTAMVQQFNALSDVEQNVFLDLVDPQPEPEPQVKQTRKKRTTKSPKAQSLESVIAKTPKAESDSNGAVDETPVANCGICGHPADHPDHDRTYLKSHDFEAPKSVATATRRSSRKAAAANITPSSETGAGAAMGASGD